VLATRLWSLVEVEIVLKGQEEAGEEHGALFGLLLICLGRVTLRMDISTLCSSSGKSGCAAQQYKMWVVVMLVCRQHRRWLSFQLIFSGLFVTVAVVLLLNKGHLV